MNKVAMFAAAAGAAVFFVGCGPDLAQVEYGSEEARWQQVIRDNYSGYEAPRTAPPAVVDNVSPRLIEEEQLRKSQSSDNATAPAEVSDDPAAAIDKAADGSSAEVKEDPAPQAEDKTEAKPADADKKAETKPADADKKAETKEADAKKADAGKPEAKKEAVQGDVYEVVAGDSLGKIAQKFYGDARRFDIIVNANGQLKANPDKLRVGMKLVIPKI